MSSREKKLNATDTDNSVRIRPREIGKVGLLEKTDELTLTRQIETGNHVHVTGLGS